MKRILLFIAFVLSTTLFLFFFVTPNHADQLDDLTKQINDLTSQLNQSVNATRPLESQLTSMQQQIADIKTQVANIDADVAQKQKNIDEGYKNIVQQEQLLNVLIRNYYIKTSYTNPLLIFFSTSSIDQITRTLAYQQAAVNQDKQQITNLALSIVDLEQKKKDLQDEETRLSALKANLDDQSAKLDKIVQGAKAYQASLSNQIAQLSAQQQQLLAAKLGSLGLPTSAYTTSGGCSSDLTNGKDPGFSPKLGLFTYGVPHRVGMSQYGAKGRADAGQNSDTILHAYYNFDSLQNMSGITIKVNDGDGFNTGNIIWTGSLEDYVKRIYEVPDNWPIESLKAQAIAARSYVLATTNNGAASICTTQSCQVFKTDPKGGNWDSAVNQTTGQVMVQGGQPIKAWFSSTAGGYFHSSSDVGWSSTSFTKSGFDGTGSVNSFADLNNNAYDKSSPWFYCDWGGRSAYNGTAWLKPEELADIVNVLLLAQADSSTQKHLSQTDKPNPDGVETWDSNQVKQELQNRGITPFNTISSGSVNADFGSGTTTTINFTGDGGSKSFSGNDFKNYFNLRAPSNINIVGPLYNIEIR